MVNWASSHDLTVTGCARMLQTLISFCQLVFQLDGGDSHMCIPELVSLEGSLEVCFVLSQHNLADALNLKLPQLYAQAPAKYHDATPATEFAPCRHLTQPCQCDLQKHP